MQQERVERVSAREVYDIEDLAKRLPISQKEEQALKRLFGRYLTGAELLANLRRIPRFR